jgi:hypothetical protein
MEILAAAIALAYYWLWDVSEWLSVLRGERESHTLRPYASGIFETPFPVREIGGGSFDAESKTLYVTLQRADDGQGVYANPPVIAAFTVKDLVAPGGGGGDGESPQEALIGNFRKTRLLCVQQQANFMVRVEFADSRKELKSVPAMARSFRKALAKLSARKPTQKTTRTRHSLKTLLRKLQLCKQGRLEAT